MKPWTHGWHMRPDVVIRTGVIEPFWTRVVSPVDVARHTIDPFIESVRPRGPAVAPTPEPERVAEAAVKVAEQFEKGKDAYVRIGYDRVRVTPSMPPAPGIVGAIVRAAQGLVRRKPVAITIGRRRVVVREHRRPGRRPRRTIVREHRIMTAPTPPPPAPTPAAVAVRPTPMPVPTAPAAPGMAMPIFQHPYHIYGRQYRRNIFAERPYEWQTEQAWLAKRAIPGVVNAVRRTTRRPLLIARQQVRPAAKTWGPTARAVQRMAERSAAPFKAYTDHRR